jgi:hypothetical protein
VCRERDRASYFKSVSAQFLKLQQAQRAGILQVATTRLCDRFPQSSGICCPSDRLIGCPTVKCSSGRDGDRRGFRPSDAPRRQVVCVVRFCVFERGQTPWYTCSGDP